MVDCKDHGQKGDRDGYGKTTRLVDGTLKCLRLHRAIFYDANGYWPPVVRHTCDNPRCIEVTHLVGGTTADNNRDRSIRVRSASVGGTLNPMHKLSDADIVAIRNSTATKRAIAERFGINIRTVFKIRSGERR